MTSHLIPEEEAVGTVEALQDSDEHTNSGVKGNSSDPGVQPPCGYSSNGEAGV